MSSTLDKLEIMPLILISEYRVDCIVSFVVCWEMSARKDIFDTFINGRSRMCVYTRLPDNAEITTYYC